MAERQGLPPFGYTISAVGVLGSRLRIVISAPVPGTDGPRGSLYEAVYTRWVGSTGPMEMHHFMQTTGQISFMADEDEDEYNEYVHADNADELMHLLKRMLMLHYTQMSRVLSSAEIRMDLDALVLYLRNRVIAPHEKKQLKYELRQNAHNN